jgi:hypothetical protein
MRELQKEGKKIRKAEGILTCKKWQKNRTKFCDVMYAATPRVRCRVRFAYGCPKSLPHLIS